MVAELIPLTAAQGTPAARASLKRDVFMGTSCVQDGREFCHGTSVFGGLPVVEGVPADQVILAFWQHGRVPAPWQGRIKRRGMCRRPCGRYW